MPSPGRSGDAMSRSCRGGQLILIEPGVLLPGAVVIKGDLLAVAVVQRHQRVEVTVNALHRNSHDVACSPDKNVLLLRDLIGDQPADRRPIDDLKRLPIGQPWMAPSVSVKAPSEALSASAA